MKKRRCRSPFTLLEICVCLAILSIASGFLAIHAKKAIDAHRFRQSVLRLKTEFQKAQILAISHQSDITATIYRRKGEYFFQLTTNEPTIPRQACQYISLPAVGQMTAASRDLSRLELTIYSSGRIEPPVLVGLHRKDESLWLDLRQSLQIKISNTYPENITTREDLR